MKTITILLLSILLNGCGATQNAPSSLTQDMSEKNLNGNFVVATLDGKLTSDKKLTLVFDNTTKSVSGFSGCNNFTGTYTVAGDKLSFSKLASTKIMCQDDANTTESYFLKTLANTTNFNLEGENITLLNNTKVILNASKIMDTETMQKQDSGMSFRYAAATRGSYTLIEIDQDAIKSQFNRSDIPNIKACNKTDWTTLKSLTDPIDAKSLNKLEAPSKAHQYDGAAAASLTITIDGVQYSTPSFDAGNPPKEIAALVNKILELANPVTKKED